MGISQQEFLQGGGFKKISSDDFLGGGGFKVVDEQPPQKRIGFLQTTPGKILSAPGRAAEFIGKDILGQQPKEEGFLKSTFQKTLGSRGLAGVFQLPGKTIQTEFSQERIAEISDSQRDLANKTASLMRDIQDWPAGEKKTNTMKVIKGNLAQIEAMEGLVKEFEEKQIGQEEVISTTARGAATTASLGFGQPATALEAAGLGAGVGALTGVAEQVEIEDQTVGGALTGIALNSALTALFFLGAYGAGKAFEGLTKRFPERLYKSSLKQSTADLKKELSEQAPDLANQLIEKGVRGSENKMYTQSVTAINSIENQINNAMKKEGSKKILTTKIASSLDDVARKFQNVLGDDGVTAINQVKDNVLAKGKEITLNQALQFKRDIYKVLSNNAFNVNATLSQKAEALRVVANSLMKEISKTSPEIGKLTSQQQMWIRTAQAMEGVLARSNRANIIGLNDVILGSGGVSNASLITLVAGSGRRVLETTRAKTAGAVTLDRIGQFVEKLPTDKTGRILKTQITDLISRFTGGFGE